jgi:hypothetical protein
MSCIITNAYSNGNQFSLDSLVIERDSSRVKYMTKSYIEGTKLYNTQIRGELSDYPVVFTAESLHKIEQDGGMLKILERCLSRENYEKLSNRVSFDVGAVMNQEGYVLGNSFTLYDKNLYDIILSEEEVSQIFNYIKKLRFEYQGHAKGDYVLSFFMAFNLRK